MFSWTAVFVDDYAVVNSYGIKTVLANGFRIFFINGKSAFSNVPKSLPKNTPDCLTLCNRTFGNFIIAEEFITKSLWSLKTCVLVDSNLCGELSSSLKPVTKFYEFFKVNTVP